MEMGMQREAGNLNPYEKGMDDDPPIWVFHPTTMAYMITKACQLTLAPW